MSALINPYNGPTERCSQLCSEVSFLLQQDVEVEHAKLHAQVEDIPIKTTVFSEKLSFVHVACGVLWMMQYIFISEAKTVDTPLFHR